MYIYKVWYTTRAHQDSWLLQLTPRRTSWDAATTVTQEGASSATSSSTSRWQNVRANQKVRIRCPRSELNRLQLQTSRPAQRSETGGCARCVRACVCSIAHVPTTSISNINFKHKFPSGKKTTHRRHRPQEQYSTDCMKKPAKILSRLHQETVVHNKNLSWLHGESPHLTAWRNNLADCTSTNWSTCTHPKKQQQTECYIFFLWGKSGPNQNFKIIPKWPQCQNCHQRSTSDPNTWTRSSLNFITCCHQSTTSQCIQHLERNRVANHHPNLRWTCWEAADIIRSVEKALATK